MAAFYKNYLRGLQRLWIQKCGLSKAAREQVAERVKGRVYYTLFDDIYSQAHKAGAERLFDRSSYARIEQVLEDFLAQYAGHPPDTEVIDFGCGEGIQTLYLALRGFRVTGVDISPTAIARAQAAAPAGVALQYYVEDVLDLRRCASDYFDLGINIGCLHMLVTDEHRHRHIQEMGRVLKPGGALLSFNNLSRRDVVIKDAERYLHSFIAVDETKPVEVRGRKAEIQFKGVGFRRASEAQYRAEFEREGFEILKTKVVRTGTDCKQWLRLGPAAGERYLVLHGRKNKSGVHGER